MFSNVEKALFIDPNWKTKPKVKSKSPLQSLKQALTSLVLNFSAIDLLERMLELDADKRITAEQALAHPYLAQYADPTDEPSSLPYDQTFEDFDLPVDQWKGKQWFF